MKSNPSRPIQHRFDFGNHGPCPTAFPSSIGIEMPISPALVSSRRPPPTTNPASPEGHEPVSDGFQSVARPVRQSQPPTAVGPAGTRARQRWISIRRDQSDSTIRFDLASPLQTAAPPCHHPIPSIRDGGGSDELLANPLSSHLVDQGPTSSHRFVPAKFLINLLPIIARDDRAFVHAVGVMPDHVHVALSIPPSIAVSTVVKNLKGKSSRQLGRQEWGSDLPWPGWQGSYGVLTFGDRSMKDVVYYVLNQEKHHRDQTLRDLFEQDDQHELGGTTGIDQH